MKENLLLITFTFGLLIKTKALKSCQVNRFYRILSLQFKWIGFFFLVGVLVGGGLLISTFIKFQTGIINKDNIHSIELRNGDLLFRRGRSVESFAVYLADREREFTHVGIIVEENGIPWVVHVVPGEQGCKSDRIRKESPAFFLSPENASSFAVVRSDFDHETLTRVAEQALLFYQKRFTFDDQYDLSTENKLYCTELILKAFQNANNPLQGIETRELDYVLGKHSIVLPGEILRNPAFKRIEITQPFIIKN